MAGIYQVVYISRALMFFFGGEEKGRENFIFTGSFCDDNDDDVCASKHYPKTNLIGVRRALR